MDLTKGSYAEKSKRAKKMMLWFGIISLIMSFAGWTSAYIVSRSREDWLKDLELPNAFFISVFVIIVSSVTMILAKRSIKKESHSQGMIFLVLTFGLGIVFITNQISGFSELIGQGHYFTGPISNPKSSFIFLIAAVHILHVVAGLISLLVVIYNHFKQKYNLENLLGVELAATFWHFVDILWLYLFLFLYFVK
jgi:cytochrome c oxidase subunit 3